MKETKNETQIAKIKLLLFGLEKISHKEEKSSKYQIYQYFKDHLNLADKEHVKSKLWGRWPAFDS